MDWTHADTEIDGAIQRLRDDQRFQVQTSEDAELVKMRANDAADRAQGVIDTCRQRLREDADEIERLQSEQA